MKDDPYDRASDLYDRMDSEAHQLLYLDEVKKFELEQSAYERGYAAGYAEGYESGWGDSHDYEDSRR